ncbi:MAG: four helix bundle protein [Acidobacteria bacterium]|nr:four helix bundle protein [Acidobacteriota bacterium]
MKPGSRNYKDLLVWQKAFSLVKATYQLTSGFPPSETYGLTAQMRRAAVSIPSNIAEGQARQSVREFAQFVSHAEGSAAELETQLLIAISLNFCSAAAASDSMEAISEIRKMLSSLRRNLSSRPANPAGTQLTTKN